MEDPPNLVLLGLKDPSVENFEVSSSGVVCVNKGTQTYGGLLPSASRTVEAARTPTSANRTPTSAIKSWVTLLVFVSRVVPDYWVIYIDFINTNLMLSRDDLSK